MLSEPLHATSDQALPESPTRVPPAPAAVVADRPDVSVVIVHYETPELLVRCLEALKASESPLRLEVFVIDNGSTRFNAQAARAAYPGVQVLENEHNLGFSRASNQGLRLARGRYFLLLNPDAFVAPETLRVMTAYMDERPDVGCATCRLELPDGSLDVACRRLFATPRRSLFRVTMLSKLFPKHHSLAEYNLTYLDEWEETEIDQPCGAFMMVRSEVAASVGLLSERYFMYCEDTDWSYRMKQAGWRIMYAPITTVEHIKGASSSQDRPRAIRNFHTGMRIFYDDHYRHQYSLAVTAMVHVAISLRERVQLVRAGLTGSTARSRGEQHAAVNRRPVVRDLR
jgi:GT2 family glycosyltransferase